MECNHKWRFDQQVGGGIMRLYCTKCDAINYFDINDDEEELSQCQ